ncbi:MAG: methyltransferase domain-containing protein [Elusimicrobia bacterium]|nr:methyltransferase domain-containing protein [Elusimicrobiota bacterium]
MNNQLLEILACPGCHGHLELSVDRGTMDQISIGSLACRPCRKEYAIKDDIPYFCPGADQDGGVKNQKRTYSAWWDLYHGEQSIIDQANIGAFHESLKISPQDIEGRAVLDAGCGNGRFSYVMSHYNPQLLVAFDLSSGLTHAKKAIAKHNPGSNMAYVQGDITRPPFSPNAFDIVISWGVITHTPNARRTFGALSALVNKNGAIGIYVYEFHPLYKSDRHWLSLIAYVRSLFLVKPLRYLCSRLPTRLTHWFFMPIYYVERFFNFGIVGCHGFPRDPWNKDRYFRTAIDRFKTRYTSEHQFEEIVEWFAENGYAQMKLGGYPRLSLTGTKNSESSPGTLNLTITHNAGQQTKQTPQNQNAAELSLSGSAS